MNKGIFRAQIPFKKETTETIKKHLSEMPADFPSNCTKPMDASINGIYSSTIPYCPNSFLQLGTNSQPKNDKSNYLPKVPPPLYMDSEMITHGFAKNYSENDKYWGRQENGIMTFKDEELLKQMRGIIGEMLGKMVKGIFTSSMANFSVPVRFNENRSFTDRMSDVFRNAHVYLKKASMVSDPVERLKLFTVNTISTMLIMLRPAKSFNPILGETFQCGFKDGSELFVEQTSHHPPVTHFYAVGPANCYTCYGYQTIEAKIKPTNGRLIFKNRVRLQLKDGSTLDVVKFPSIKMLGIMSGKRQMHFTDYLEIVDYKNKLKSLVFFDIASSTGMTKMKDDIEGIIYKYKDCPPKPIKCLKDINDIDSEIAHIDGSWYQKMNIGGVMYWNKSDSSIMPVIFATNPLPSDVRYREDIIWVKRKNNSYAEPWKDALEIRQREDKKQRKKYNPNDDS